MSTLTYPLRKQKIDPLGMAIRILLLGILLFSLSLTAIFTAFQLYYAGHIYPGVRMSGLDLSGLTLQEAAVKLSQTIQYPQTGKIIFRDQDQLWMATPAELGFLFDPVASAAAAYQIGRHGSLSSRIADQFQALLWGITLQPTLIFDQNTAYNYLASLARQIDHPVLEASLGLEGPEVVVRSGQVGRTLNIDASLALLTAQLQTMSDGVINLFVTETPPVILDASEQAEVARRILAEPLTLNLPNPREGDPGPWKFDQAALASMLAIERIPQEGAEKYQVVLNTTMLRSFLLGLAPELYRSPLNARFIFNDDTRKLDLLEHAIIGRELDVEATIQAINDQLYQGQHTIELVTKKIKPPVTDDSTAEELGITELVSAETSYFYGSSASRIKNIKLASARFHGYLVAPGETVSMAQILGDVSLDNGYAEALIIVGDQTIKGVGGGVCQVSTTLFRTAFFGGFPINERHAHAYRVYYYEKTASNGINPRLAGLDATVFVPVVDFKFTNDTPYWLLMETYVSNSSLTWKFYSTSDGRTVEWDTTGPVNIVEPPKPLYKLNKDLGKNEFKQIDWEAEGADVTVTRTVRRNGEIYIRDQFYTHYLPWRAIYEYGPGSKLPKDAVTEE